MNIDRKFEIKAINPVSGKEYTEENSVLFLAKDKAFLRTLYFYLEECRKLDSNPEHLESIRLLIGRVTEFQKDESKVPDTLGEEINRCVHGVGV